MGYTHYLVSKKKTIANKKKWASFATDCKKIFEYSQKELGIDLANGLADENSQPEIDNDVIMFNGSEQQRLGVWTTTEKISIPWPADNAIVNEPNADPIAEKTSGNWFAGSLLKQRVAPISDETGLGSGSYETMCIERCPSEDDKFSFCKTAFRPYDLVVTAVLIAAKEHFGENIEVSSDGDDSNWLDAKILCNNVLGYGLNFEMNKDKKELVKG